jgi:hypothetical protein
VRMRPPIPHPMTAEGWNVNFGGLPSLSQRPRPQGLTPRPALSARSRGMNTQPRHPAPLTSTEGLRYLGGEGRWGEGGEGMWPKVKSPSGESEWNLRSANGEKQCRQQVSASVSGGLKLPPDGVGPGGVPDGGLAPRSPHSVRSHHRGFPGRHRPRHGRGPEDPGDPRRLRTARPFRVSGISGVLTATEPS